MVSQETPKPRLLLICNRKSLVQKVVRIVTDALPHLDVELAESGTLGLTHIYQNPPTVIVVDSALHDISGLQLCRVLKHDPAIRKLPLAMICSDEIEPYVKFNELALFADLLLEEGKVVATLAENIQMLLKIFSGLEAEELSQLHLLQQQSAQVNAANRLVQLMDQSITEVTIMNRFRKLFELVGNKSVMIHMLFSLLGNVLDYDVAAVFFNDKTRDPRVLTFHVQKEWQIAESQFDLWTQRIFDELKPQSQEQWLFSSTRFEPIHAELANPDKPLTSIKHQTLYPFFIEKNLVGALVLYSRHPVNFDLIFPFQLLLQEMSALMRIRRYFTEAQMFTVTDELTGLYSYQYFLWHTDREMREARRHQTPLTIVALSLDDLPADEDGANMADKALKHVAQACQETFRSLDFVARSRGRSLLVLLPNTDATAARKAVNRLRHLVSESSLPGADTTLEITLSIGMVALSEEIGAAGELLEKADAALETARLKGRNAVELIQ